MNSEGEILREPQPPCTTFVELVICVGLNPFIAFSFAAFFLRPGSRNSSLVSRSLILDA